MRRCARRCQLHRNNKAFQAVKDATVPSSRVISVCECGGGVQRINPRLRTSAPISTVTSAWSNMANMTVCRTIRSRLWRMIDPCTVQLQSADLHTSHPPTRLAGLYPILIHLQAAAADHKRCITARIFLYSYRRTTIKQERDSL